MERTKEIKVRRRIIGDLGEFYDPEPGEWDRLCRNLSERLRHTKITLQESLWDMESLEMLRGWETIAEYNGSIENG